MDGWRPRIRDSVMIQEVGGELLVIFTASRKVKRFTATDLVTRAIPRLDGTRSVAELEDVLADHSGAIPAMLEVMAGEAMLSKSASPTGESAIPGADYYDRQLRMFQDFCDEGLSDTGDGAELQRRLGASTVTVCGLGGLGSWVSSMLARSGVGVLRLCDVDRVERSNLTRQILFTADDIGHSKVDVAADRLRQENPYISVEPTSVRITGPACLAGLVDGADLVINCTDQPSVVTTAGWVSEACWPARIPHIVGGAYNFHVGAVGYTVIPGKTACWPCLRAEVLPDHDRDQAAGEPLLGNRKQSGMIGPLAGIVGAIIAWEALRVLTGLPTALTDRWTELDYWPLTTQTRPIPRRPSCPRCGTSAV
jgi:molybdopterin/thiamine biosynthesis adenylyltransferase